MSAWAMADPNRWRATCHQHPAFLSRSRQLNMTFSARESQFKWVLSSRTALEPGAFGISLPHQKAWSNAGFSPTTPMCLHHRPTESEDPHVSIPNRQRAVHPCVTQGLALDYKQLRRLSQLPHLPGSFTNAVHRTTWTRTRKPTSTRVTRPVLFHKPTTGMSEEQQAHDPISTQRVEEHLSISRKSSNGSSPRPQIPLDLGA